jgi:hypothetical protein
LAAFNRLDEALARKRKFDERALFRNQPMSEQKTVIRPTSAASAISSTVTSSKPRSKKRARGRRGDALSGGEALSRSAFGWD